MALQNTPETSGTSKTNPSILDLGTFYVDSDIIFGFTSHLLRRKAKVVEGCSSRETPLSLELGPRKRRQFVEEDQCSSRPPPEGAGSVTVSEASPLERREGKGNLCKKCQLKLAELKRQALALAVPGSFKDPGFAALLFDKLQVPEYPQKGRHEGDNCCEVCATHLNQLRQEALQMVQALAQTGSKETPDFASSTFSGIPQRTGLHNMVTLSSSKDWALQASRQTSKPTNTLPGADRRKGLGWPQGVGNIPKSSVQVTVGPGALSSTLSSVTIQAQQYLEGMWSISRVNNFLPQACLTQATMAENGKEGPGTEATYCSPSSCVQAQPQNSTTPGAQGMLGQAGVSPGTSAAASFFIRAAQKLNLSSKRKKHHPPLPHSQEPSVYPTSFSGILQLSPPPAPPCLLRAVSKVKDNPGMGKVKVMVRICPSQGAHDTSESMSFLKVDPRKKQLTLYEPSANGHSNSGHRRTVVAAPKMFAFDAVFTQDASQAEVCSGTVAEVIQSVVNGADGCIFCFGHVKLGKTFTMIGRDNSTQNLGIVPCAISWLFKLINERKEKTGTRFSIRVSAVEICGKDETLKDLLSDVASGSLQDGQSPGVYLREDPICGTQLQNQSELRAPTAEKAAFFLDAAIAARSTSKPDCDEEERRNSHMLFTLHIYQYRMEKSGKGGMSGGRSRLHLIDLGSCEKVLSKSRDGGGGLCLSLTALGNVVLALANGAKHVPYRDSKLTMLLRESLGNINCRTTMIAHISDYPANYAETLTTIQLASRIHRMRKKKSKYASSSSGGDSSCEEGRVRRPPHLRPFHPRTIALDPDLPVLSISSDPDYSSSSEQSCDTVIYVGPGGAALSDCDLTDNEGPPEFVPIIPSLNRKRVKEGPYCAIRKYNGDHLKCNTFAELQERLEYIDGSEEPSAFTMEEGLFDAKGGQVSLRTESVASNPGKEGSVPSPRTCAKAATQGSLSPKRTHHSPAAGHMADGSPLKSKWPTAQSDGGVGGPLEHLNRTSADGEKVIVSDQCSSMIQASAAKAQEQGSEPVVREKAYFNRRPLPKPAPPPPQMEESRRVYHELEGSSVTRTPPVGMSHQALKKEPGSSPVLGKIHPMSRTPVDLRSKLRGTCFDRDILTTTVTLKQPVELNGEDELVFTVVEELSIGGMLDNGRPSSIISFNSDCSLQALASGSRPVSIISSINDEFDAYTSQVAASGVNIDLVSPFSNPFVCSGSRRSSISSWLSDVSLCTLESDGVQSSNTYMDPEGAFCLDSLGMLHKEILSPHGAKSSMNDSGFCFSELDSDSAASSKLSLSVTKCQSTPESSKAAKTAACPVGKANTLNNSQIPSAPQVVHSSLPRKMKPTSTAAHCGSSSIQNCCELQQQEGRPDDPWLMRMDNHSDSKTTDSVSKLSRSGTSIPTKKSGMNISSVHLPAKSQVSSSSQRVVDGCEKSSSKKSELPSKMPQFRRGATTLGTVPVIHNQPSSESKGNHEGAATTGSLKSSSLGKKATVQKGSLLPKPGGTSPPAPPVRKSSLDQKNRVLLPPSALQTAGQDAGTFSAPKAAEEEVDVRSKVEPNSHKTSSLKAEHTSAKTTSSLKPRGAKIDAGQCYGSQISLEKCDSLSSVGSKAGLSRENCGASLVNNGRTSRSVPRLGVPPSTSTPTATSPPSCAIPGPPGKTGQIKGSINPKAVGICGNKTRTLSASSSSKPLTSSTKSLTPPTVRSANLPLNGKPPTRSMPGVNGKPGRGTIMGTKQAIRAANSRVSELASGSSGKGHFRASGDSDSGNDSGVNLSDDKSPLPMLPSPYSKITAPRRAQRYSSGHGSDNSSVLSGELPPAMGRTALFYHSGGSSGYESMIRDSEATGSASSAHDSMSESGMSSSGRTRTSKSPKKRSAGLQRRRLIPASLPDTSSLGRKPSTTGQWVDLPPLPGTLKEPFEIKVYEIDDVERLQRHRHEDPVEPFQDVEKGLLYFNTKLKLLERRHQQIRELKAKHDMLKVELEDTKQRLMMDPGKWTGEFEVDLGLDKESQEYLEALEQATEELEYCVNLCKSRVMMVTCFDIGMVSDMQDGLREVEV
ncbi:kinesin-like protein KIF26A isoform X2 [Acipenser ruthenus]|uniref:kinesin-like protein KIF26A isoform X2 n=1 Tax=Acipenser ruthenus TaxID=7906 RepID=UPI00274265C6|nr:kinesin-like protein KIF26A isoform X2 [Acipenser ruthenus]